MEYTESDGLTESVTEESAEDSPVMRDQPVKGAKKGRKYKSMVRKLRNRVNDKMANPKVVKPKAATVDKGMVPRTAAGKRKSRCHRCFESKEK